jgi:hypothetical protein
MQVLPQIKKQQPEVVGVREWPLSSTSYPYGSPYTPPYVSSIKQQSQKRYSPIISKSTPSFMYEPTVSVPGPSSSEFNVLQKEKIADMIQNRIKDLNKLQITQSGNNEIKKVLSDYNGMLLATLRGKNILDKFTQTEQKYGQLFNRIKPDLQLNRILQEKRLDKYRNMENITSLLIELQDKNKEKIINDIKSLKDKLEDYKLVNESNLLKKNVEINKISDSYGKLLQNNKKLIDKAKKIEASKQPQVMQKNIPYQPAFLIPSGSQTLIEVPSPALTQPIHQDISGASSPALTQSTTSSSALSQQTSSSVSSSPALTQSTTSSPALTQQTSNIPQQQSQYSTVFKPIKQQPVSQTDSQSSSQYHSLASTPSQQFTPQQPHDILLSLQQLESKVQAQKASNQQQLAKLQAQVQAQKSLTQQQQLAKLYAQELPK